MTPDIARRLADTGVDAPFWSGLADGAVRLPQCASCDHWLWPAQPSCPTCLGTDFAWRDVAPTGVVYSWTRTWYPFVDVRADELPYIVVLAEIPAAGGVRVLGVYAGDAADDLAVGDAVRGVIAGPADRTYGLPSLTWVRAAPDE